ncbi:unnamed protein product [Gordionus sp. m RMFG-2023]
MIESDSIILDTCDVKVRPCISMNSDAKIYASRNNLQSLIVRKILNQWLHDGINPLFYHKTQLNGARIKDKDNIEERYHILDIGCGDGASTMLIHDTILNSKNGLKGTTVGLDVLPEMIAHANEKLTIKIKDDEGNNNDLSFKVGNILNIDELPEEWFHAFDLVLSFNCMHWMEDQIQALSNIAKFLKPNGVFISVLIGERTEVMINSLDKVLDIQKTINNNQEDISDGKLNKIKPTITQEIRIMYKKIGTYLEELSKLDSMLYFPWKRPHMLTENPVKTYEEYMKKAGFINTKIIPINKIRFICLPSMEYMNKVHMSFFPNLDKIIDFKLKEEFIELFNSFCFEFNKNNHDNELNHLSPEHYIIGHF